MALDLGTIGFESLKRLLMVNSNTLNKVIAQGLISFDESGDERVREYSLWDATFLSSARIRPLRIDPSDELALVCSLGIEDFSIRPSIFFDEKWGQRQAELLDLQRCVSGLEWDLICAGQLHVSGHWRVKESISDKMVETKSPILASYAGFILDGGRLVREVKEAAHPNSGGRLYLVEPLSPSEKRRFTHNYLESRPGPPNRVWTAEQLLKISKTTISALGFPFS